MSPRTTDHALRRLVAEIARARPEDVEGVLGRLAEDQRARVRELLAAFVGREVEPAKSASPVPPRRPPPACPPGLSGWLRERVEAAAVGTAMTRTVAAALQASAAEAAEILGATITVEPAARAETTRPARWRLLRSVRS